MIENLKKTHQKNAADSSSQPRPFTINYTLLSIRGTVVSEKNQEIKYNVMQHTDQALALSSNRSIFWQCCCKNWIKKVES